MNDEISRQLREAAEAHQPDRDRMLARVHRGMTATAAVPRRRPGIARSWPVAVLAGSAAAGILAVAGFAIAGSGQTTPARPDGETTLTVTSPDETPSPTQTPRATGGPAAPPATGQPGRTAAGRPSSSTPAPAIQAGARVTDGPVSAQGSIDPHSTVYWAQSTLTFETGQPLTALVVEVRVMQTGGVQSTGQWQTAPADDFTVTAQESDGAVVFRWELKPGRTVPAAHQTFAVQYNHATGARSAGLDSYHVQATAADGAHTVRGGFTPAN